MYGLIRHISKLDNGQLGSAQLCLAPASADGQAEGEGTQKKRRMIKYILSTLFFEEILKL